MPIYEYRCSECGKEFEMMQKITDDPLSKCKFCHGNVQKLISNSSFHLKGTGWYVTDYARKSGNNNSSGSPAGTAKEAEKTASSDKATSSDKTASESKDSGSNSGDSKSSSTAKQASNA